MDPKVQAWAGRLIELLREAHRAVVAAASAVKDHLDAELLADLRARYDTDVEWGWLTNRCWAWKVDANHPGHVLARRLAAMVAHAAVPGEGRPGVPVARDGLAPFR